MSDDTYERLDDCEVHAVRDYRRKIWAERAVRDRKGARTQVVASLRKYADAWVDGINIVTLTSVTMPDRTVGDLTASQRYALISLLEDGAE